MRSANHTHGTRFNTGRSVLLSSQSNPPTNPNSISTNASETASQLRVALLKKSQQRQRLQTVHTASNPVANNDLNSDVAVPPVAPRRCNLNEANKLALYQLIEVYQPAGPEHWKRIAVEFNKTQSTKRNWQALKKHYLDTVRRATVRPSGSAQKPEELDLALNLEEHLTGEYSGTILGSRNNRSRPGVGSGNNNNNNNNSSASNNVNSATHNDELYYEEEEEEQEAAIDSDINNSNETQESTLATFAVNSDVRLDGIRAQEVQAAQNIISIVNNHHLVPASESKHCDSKTNYVSQLTSSTITSSQVPPAASAASRNGGSHTNRAFANPLNNNYALPSASIAPQSHTVAASTAPRIAPPAAAAPVPSMPTSIVQITRGSNVRRSTDDPAGNTTSTKRARLDVELIKFVQQLSAKTAASGNNNNNNSSGGGNVQEFQQLVLNVQSQCQQMLQQQQQHFCTLLVNVLTKGNSGEPVNATSSNLNTNNSTTSNTSSNPI
jgi:hypothetical protein